jgi:hypothetical protein
MCFDDDMTVQHPFANDGCLIAVKHVYGKVQKHEQSDTHKQSVNAYLRAKSEQNIKKYVNTDMIAKRHQEVV